MYNGALLPTEAGDIDHYPDWLVTVEDLVEIFRCGRVRAREFLDPAPIELD